MSDPFIGEIRILPYMFAPRSWAYCDGQLISVSQNTALFSLYGTTYGGDGRTTFALPDMQGRVPMQAGQGPGLADYRLGVRTGVDYVPLTETQLPQHTHTVGVANVDADLTTPQHLSLGRAVITGRGGRTSPQPAYLAPANLVDMNADAVTSAGDGEPHENRQPYLAINFCASLFGVYPSRN